MKLPLLEAAERIRRDPDMREIIDRCEKQKRFEGEIAGIPFVGISDLHDPETNANYDFKYMRNFGDAWDDISRSYIEWFYAYHYDWQAAIYDRLSGGGSQYLIAATKDAVPDIGFWQFDRPVLDHAMKTIINVADRFWQTINEKRPAWRCEKCDYCRSTKRLRYPDLISY